MSWRLRLSAPARPGLAPLPVTPTRPPEIGCTRRGGQRLHSRSRDSTTYVIQEETILFKKIMVMGALAAMTGLAQADLLTFDPTGNCISGTDCTIRSAFSQTYGDTPLIDVSTWSTFTTFLNAPANAGSGMKFWDNDYLGLTNVAYGDSSVASAIVLSLTPLGAQVTLNSLDLAGYQGGFSTAITVFSTSDLLNPLFAFAGTVGAAQTLTFSNVSSTTGLLIKFGPDAFNVGIDNISYTVTAVPEPATLALMAAGLGVVGAAARRRRQPDTA